MSSELLHLIDVLGGLDLPLGEGLGEGGES